MMWKAENELDEPQVQGNNSNIALTSNRTKRPYEPAQAAAATVVSSRNKHSSSNCFILSTPFLLPRKVQALLHPIKTNVLYPESTRLELEAVDVVEDISNTSMQCEDIIYPSDHDDESENDDCDDETVQLSNKYLPPPRSRSPAIPIHRKTNQPESSSSSSLSTGCLDANKDVDKDILLDDNNVDVEDIDVDEFLVWLETEHECLQRHYYYDDATWRLYRRITQHREKYPVTASSYHLSTSSSNITTTTTHDDDNDNNNTINPAAANSIITESVVSSTANDSISSSSLSSSSSSSSSILWRVAGHSHEQGRQTTYWTNSWGNVRFSSSSMDEEEGVFHMEL